MTWRKWIVRGLSYGVLALLAGAAAAYFVLTNPGLVRRKVIEEIDNRLVGVSVSLESARFKPLGGITLRELRLARRDDLNRGDFLYAPAGVVYHDKERFFAGHGFAVRLIELNRPRLRVVRERDGRWNLSDLFAVDPNAAAERLPMFVLNGGTVTLEDRGLSPSAPLLEVRDVQLSVVNDPLTTLTVEATGQTDVLGPLRLTARLDRGSGAVTAAVELPAVRVDAPLVDRLALLSPELAGHLRRLTGNAVVKAAFVYRPGGERPLHYEVDVRLADGTFAHDKLPLTLGGLTFAARCVDGVVPSASLTAGAGPVRVTASLKDLPLPPDANAPFDAQAAELSCVVEHLTLEPKVFAALPAPLQTFQADYSPAGALSVDYQSRRQPDGHRLRTWAVRPEGMSAEFSGFRYKVERITGVVRHAENDAGHERCDFDLLGYAGAVPVTLKGYAEGDDRLAVDLTIAAKNLPLDGKLLHALPESGQRLASQFNLAGLVDVLARIERPAGADSFTNRYTATVHDAALCYDVFPYPLTQVRGVLDLFEDHWECRDFSGRHGDGEIRFHGRSWPLTSSPPGQSTAAPGERVELNIDGLAVLLDRQFEEALAPPAFPGRAPLARTCRMLNLAGRLSFSAHIDDLPNQPQDLDVTVSVNGCTMKPKFFEY